MTFFTKKIVWFLNSTIVYIILPIHKNLVNVRVNTALVLIFSSNRPCVTTWAKISLVIGCLSFFTKGEIAATLVNN